MRAKPRHPKRQLTGVWEVDSGTAEIIQDPDSEREDAYLLLLNRVPSSSIVLGDPRRVEFEYMRWIAEILRERHPSSTLHLGGAAGSLARLWADINPGSSNTVVEYDRALTKLVRRQFPLPVNVRMVAAEARAFCHALAPGSVEMIIRDIFVGPSTPRPVRTVEFFRACKRALAVDGALVLNCEARPATPLLGEDIAGLKEVFAHVRAHGPAAAIAGQAYRNVVLVASDSEISGSVVEASESALRD